MEEPQLAEGFYEIKKVAFVAKFEGDADQKAYQSITKGKWSKCGLWIELYQSGLK